MINPQHSSAYFNRGLCYGQLKNFDRSIQDFDKCINIKADYSEAYYYRGLAKFDTGNIGCYDLIKAANLGFQPAFDALNKFCR
jgi:tetratricopeptide (TPR) repeat protein